MLIVEGPDGGGKTSLITRMQERLGFEVMPRACTSDNGIDVKTLRDWVDRDLSLPVHHHGFYDRHPLISEPIYGPLIRGHMAEGFSDVQWLSQRLAMLRNRQPLYVFCLPPLEVVVENIHHTHDLSTKHLRGVHTHARALYELYILRAAIESATPYCRVWTWDYTSPDADQDFENLVEEAKGHL